MHGGLRRALWPPRAMGAAALRRSWHGSTVCSRAPVDFTTLVTDKHRGLVRRQRTLLAELRQAIVSVNADDADLRLLDETSQHLDDLFLLCVVGEFNAGKSTIINALLGSRHLKDGITPTTDRVTLIKHNQPDEIVPSIARPQASPTERLPKPVVLELPVPWLRGMSVVDTPGTNAVIQEHTAITDAIIPKCDLLLFCTSVDRPFSESERIFLARIASWKKKVVFVLNKVDLLGEEHGGGGAKDQLKASEYVRSVASDVLGCGEGDVSVFPVSARKSLAVKEAASERNLLAAADKHAEATRLSGEAEEPGFASLERYIHSALAGPEKVAWKLSSPLGVADSLLKKYRERIEAQQQVMNEDAAVLETLARQNTAWQDDMQSDFALQLALVDNELLQMCARADDWLEEAVSLTNAYALLQPGSIRESFEKEVLSDTTHKIDNRVRDLVDWLVAKTQRQAENVLGYVQTHGISRRPEVERGMVGTVGARPTMAGGAGFESGRRALLGALQRDVQGVVASYDGRQQAVKLADTLRTTVFSTVALEASAVGVGGLVAAATLDLSGLAASGVLAASGLLVLPYQRAQLKKGFRQSVLTLQADVDKAIGEHLNKELSSAVEHIESSYSPYSLYVRTEQERVAAAANKLTELCADLTEISDCVAALHPDAELGDAE